MKDSEINRFSNKTQSDENLQYEIYIDNLRINLFSTKITNNE